MKVHAFLHVPFEGLAGIEPWLVRHGHTVACTRLWAGDPMPDPGAIDWLIVMGGPMGVHDIALYPWLQREKRLIREAIDMRKKVLGICLGAQLIADVLGARVYQHDHKEIGWYPVTLTAAGAASGWFQFRDDGTFTVFHWHGDTFELPPGSRHLARSEGCANQGFSYGEHVLALQFHMDATADSVGQMLAHCPDDLQAGPYVQSHAQIGNPAPGTFSRLSDRLGSLLEHFEERVEVR